MSEMRLLLVDDDEAFRRMLARALEMRGFEVRAAPDIGAALEIAAGWAPDYAVVDLKMPGESGLTLIRELALAHPAIRIVMLTGYASIQTAVEAIKLGATHYLAKPAGVDEIVAALHRDQGEAELEAEPEPMSVDRLEWEHIQRVLAEHDGNISSTARALKMHRRTLQRKLAKRPARA
jgi:two-component system response regulator RegA